MYLTCQKMKMFFVANRWEKTGNSGRFYFLGLQNHSGWWLQPQIKRRFLLGRKAMTNLDHVWNDRDITLPTKVHLVKAMVFPVVMHGYETCTVKKAEHQKNWCFWTVVFEKTLESPLDCKEIQPVHPKGNQSWIFIGRTDAEAQYFGHLMCRTDSLKKTLMLGKIEGRKRRGQQRMRWLDDITDSMDMSLSKLQE